jgi:RNA polymerase sigma-70 factor (ECF subfamily)
VVSSAHAGAAQSRAALANLCEAYWRPIYAYARRRGRTVDQAQDLTQAFFTQLLEKDYVARADRDRGRFRSFLLTAFKHYLSNDSDRARAQKRGGGSALLSLDFSTAEGKLPYEPAETATPETLYARQWAQTLLDRAFTRLALMEREAHPERFDRLKHCLMGAESAVGYGALADELGTTEGAIKVTVHRMRKRFGDLLRREVAETMISEDAVSEEISFLIDALGN